MIQEQYSRISHHTLTSTGFTGTTIFTVPPSEDFTDDSWSATDLALSEIGVAEGVGRAFIRIGNQVKEFNLSTGTTQNLNSVLTVGNTTGGQDIEVTSGDIIKGQTQGELNFALGGVKLTLTLDNTLNEGIIIEPNTINVVGSGPSSVGVGNNIVKITSVNEDDFIFNDYAFKTIDIGDWNMDTTADVTVAHGLSSTEYKTIINIQGIIRNDANATFYPIGPGGVASWTAPNEPTDCFIWNITSSDINLHRKDLGSFDSTSFDATSYNRGQIRFQYKPD